MIDARTMLAAALVVTTMGCARGGIRGLVNASPQCGEAPKGSSFPVEAATIRVSCPDGATMSTSTDDIGRFYIPLESRLNHECTIEVAMEGYRTRSYLLGRVCEWETTPEIPECGGASLLAHLIPEGTGAPTKEAP